MSRLRDAWQRLPRPSLPRPQTVEVVPVAVSAPATNGDADAHTVPAGLDLAAGWAWRLLVLGAAGYFVAKGLAHLSEVTIPFVVALLFTAIFWPLRRILVKHHFHSALAAAISLLALALVILGILTLVSVQIAGQWRELSDQALASFRELVTWLKNGPLHVTSGQLDTLATKATNYVNESQSKIGDYASAVGGTVSHFFAGMALTLFATFFFLHEGASLVRTAAHLIPRRNRARVLDAAAHGWVALVAYVRAAVIVAAVDGVGAMIGAAALGSSMWLAIGALTFLTCFIPLVGAVISGVVAVGVIFVTLGPVKAIIMLAVFIAVIQLEGHVMQPFLLGKAVSIHPLVVLYGIAIGVVLGGIIGALFIVPFMAFGNAFLRAWAAPPASPPLIDQASVTKQEIDRTGSQADAIVESGMGELSTVGAEPETPVEPPVASPTGPTAATVEPDPEVSLK